MPGRPGWLRTNASKRSPEPGRSGIPPRSSAVHTRRDSSIAK
ncbi:hypothetical protein SALBM135S_03624 [Streptomyces alboniger]